MTVTTQARRRPLDPVESAAASVMCAGALAAVVVGSVVRHAGPIGLFAAVPFGVLAQRHRARAVVAGGMASAFLGFLLVGTGGALDLIAYATLGGVVGDLKRRGRGIPSLFCAAAVLGALAAVVADLLLWVFASYRRLTLQTFQSTELGFRRTLEKYGPTQQSARDIDRITRAAVTHWAVAAAVAVLVATALAVVVTWVLVGAVLDRLRWMSAADLITSLPSQPVAAKVPPQPLPLRLAGVRLRYEGATSDALAGIDLAVPQGEFLAIVGDNGSGKSSLARILAGVAPTSGLVERAGRPGLGEIGGTALILQRPDTQVLGVRVADDIVWGLPPGTGVDVDGLLAEVGLVGMADAETATLSGGQLQRLALAGALARRPTLLVSDEATAMIDPQGRTDLIRLLAELPRHRPMSVVHVTHDAGEAAAADQIIRLDAGRIVSDGPGSASLPAPQGFRAIPRPARESIRPDRAGPVLTLSGVGHVYRPRSPWARVALLDVDLSIAPGEGVVIVGDNGSGKSTLAWILAGLLRPTSGSCCLRGKPVHEQRGGVGLAFQHPRLQLQRPTVADDIADAAGLPRQGRHTDTDERVAAALVDVGLDPALARRSVDALSGGQMRRVAIAGLLAREPQVLVLDEPFAGLDASGRTGLVELLASLRASSGLTLAVVSHDTDGLDAVLPRQVRLSAGSVVGDSEAGELLGVRR